jgi:hypothetical protein
LVEKLRGTRRRIDRYKVKEITKKREIKRWRLRTANRREWRGMCEASRVPQEL